MRAGAVAVLALLSGTTSATAREETSLPRSGIAVETSRGVDLVGLDGRLRRTLPGYRFRSVGVERPGQIGLRDRSGRGYELRGGRLARAAADEVTLPAGYSLRFRGHWTLLRNHKTVQRFARRMHLELDDTGTVLTFFRVSDDGRILTTSLALNLRTGARRSLPVGCRVAVERPGLRFELCGYPYVRQHWSTIVRVDARGRRRIAGPALSAPPKRPLGWWRTVTLSPKGDRLLAQWSAECEIPLAYFIDARTGRRTIIGRDGAGRQAEGRTLGWLGDAALVTLPRGACGSSAERPGVYAFDARGRANLIHPLPNAFAISTAFWR